MWSAVPGVENLSSSSGSDEELSANSESEIVGHGLASETSNASFDNTETAPPRGVTDEHWQTFCNLKRRREDSSYPVKNTAKKRKKLKTDHKDVSSSEVTTSLSSPSSSSSATNQNIVMKDDRNTSPHADKISSPQSHPGLPESSAPTQEQQKHWDTLKKYLHVNEHIQKHIDHGQYNPNKSGMEKQLDQAVSKGNFEEAEELSNQLATRELACKIAKSADARDYLKWKEGEETKKKAKRKKKKLYWGFEAKERWQMKGNM